MIQGLPPEDKTKKPLGQRMFHPASQVIVVHIIVSLRVLVSLNVEDADKRIVTVAMILTTWQPMSPKLII
jgi:hypothetical protein